MMAVGEASGAVSSSAAAGAAGAASAATSYLVPTRNGGNWKDDRSRPLCHADPYNNRKHMTKEMKALMAWRTQQAGHKAIKQQQQGLLGAMQDGQNMVLQPTLLGLPQLQQALTCSVQQLLGVRSAALLLAAAALECCCWQQQLWNAAAATGARQPYWTALPAAAAAACECGHGHAACVICR
jgi:hypothetical protein